MIKLRRLKKLNWYLYAANYVLAGREQRRDFFSSRSSHGKANHDLQHEFDSIVSTLLILTDLEGEK